jgi:hypothetical protein
MITIRITPITTPTTNPIIIANENDYELVLDIVSLPGFGI